LLSLSEARLVPRSFALIDPIAEEVCILRSMDRDIVRTPLMSAVDAANLVRTIEGAGIR